MEFNYDPILGLQYSFSERSIFIIDYCILPSLTLFEVIELFNKLGVMITNSMKVDSNLNIYWNGVICDYPIKISKKPIYNGERLDHCLLDEIGQWKTPEMILENEIIKILNEK